MRKEQNKGAEAGWEETERVGKEQRVGTEQRGGEGAKVDREGMDVEESDVVFE